MNSIKYILVSVTIYLHFICILLLLTFDVNENKNNFCRYKYIYNTCKKLITKNIKENCDGRYFSAFDYEKSMNCAHYSY